MYLTGLWRVSGAAAIIPDLLVFLAAIKQFFRSYSHWQKCCPCNGSLSIQFEFTDGYEMMHKGCSNKEEVPYCFSRSSVKFQSRRGKKSMIWLRFERFWVTTPVWIHSWLWCHIFFSLTMSAPGQPQVITVRRISKPLNLTSRTQRCVIILGGLQVLLGVACIAFGSLALKWNTPVAIIAPRIWGGIFVSDISAQITARFLQILLAIFDNAIPVVT